MEKEYTTAEAAIKWECSDRTVRNMIMRGTIQARMDKADPTVQKGTYKIPEREIKRILALLVSLRTYIKAAR